MQVRLAERYLQSIRREMRAQKLAALIIPTADPHNSEYVADRFQYRAKVSNFYGSAGTAVVTPTAAYMWTDGRYWLEAAASMPTGWQLQKSGAAGVPTLEAWLEAESAAAAAATKTVDTNGTDDSGFFAVGVDPYTYDIKAWEALAKKVALKPSAIARSALADAEATETIAEKAPVAGGDRAPPKSQLFVRQEEYCGESPTQKLSRVVKKLRKVLPPATAAETDAILLTALDDIAWLTNMRGLSDVPYNPVFISYLVIDLSSHPSASPTMHLFVDFEEATTDDAKRASVADHCKAHNIVLHPYSAIETFLTERYASKRKVVGIEEAQTNFALREVIEGRAVFPPLDDSGIGGGGGGRPASNAQNQTVLLSSRARLIPSIVKDLKGVKNAVELKGFEDCHIRDGCALVRFMAWLSNAMKQQGQNQTTTAVIRETDCCDRLEAFRAEEALFRGPSFASISSSGPNGAVIHYHPQRTDPPTDRVLARDELYLIDSGGQYEDGTTDVTRVLTFESSPPQDIVTAYTLVLKGHIALASAVFPPGVAGYRLDCLARQFLWAEGLDYAHGTGHGVGSFLCVHEGPHSVPSRLPPTSVPLVEGMILSNEPGYYEDGSYGIRIENLVSVVRADAKKMQYPNGKARVTVKPTTTTNSSSSDPLASTDANSTATTTSLAFKQLTMVPFNKDLIDANLLTATEVLFVDTYHAAVRAALAPLIEAKGDRLALKYLLAYTTPLFGGQ